MMNFQKFLIFLGELAKMMFPWEQTRIKLFMNFLFPENPDRLKTIHMDEHMKKLFDENIWR